MTRIVTVMAFFFLSLTCFSQNTSVAALQKKYSNDNAFSFEVSGNSIGSLRVLAVSSKSKSYSARDIKRLKKAIGKQNFEELMSAKSGDGQLRLLMKDRDGKPTELVLIADKDSEGFVTVNFSAKDK